MLTQLFLKILGKVSVGLIYHFSIFFLIFLFIKSLMIFLMLLATLQISIIFQSQFLQKEIMFTRRRNHYSSNFTNVINVEKEFTLKQRKQSTFKDKAVVKAESLSTLQQSCLLLKLLKNFENKTNHYCQQQRQKYIQNSKAHNQIIEKVIENFQKKGQNHEHKISNKIQKCISNNVTKKQSNYANVSSQLVLENLDTNSEQYLKKLKSEKSELESKIKRNQQYLESNTKTYQKQMCYYLKEVQERLLKKKQFLKNLSEKYKKISDYEEKKYEQNINTQKDMQSVGSNNSVQQISPKIVKKLEKMSRFAMRR